MDAGPVLGSFYQSLLHSLAENVSKPSDLGFLFVGNDDRAIAPSPDLVSPPL